MARRILKGLGWLVLVAAVGAAGLFVGTQVRTRIAPRPQTFRAEDVLDHDLPQDGDFPDVTVIDADGEPRRCRDLVAGGTVVLFLDLECSPCTDMARRWQDALGRGVIAPAQLWAITVYPRDAITAYQDDNGFTFPIYEDRDQVFRHDYGVKQYPLEVTVGASGKIRRTTFDSVTPIDPHALAARLAR